MNYIDFASSISFFEFLQDEFKNPHFDVSKYIKEIKLLGSSMTIESFVNAFAENPRLFDVFEELLQLKRFTNTQYIHFCFDVDVLNNGGQSVVIKYINNSIFKFENGESNENFCDIYNSVRGEQSESAIETIFYVKRAIVKYIKNVADKSKVSKKRRGVLYNHIQKSLGARFRIARYLIDNLNALEQLASVDLETFLKHKRHPIDTKGLHGNFGTSKVSKVLESEGFTDVSYSVEKPVLSLEDISSIDMPIPRFAYLREKAIQGVNKRKDGKPKKFDYILLCNGLPMVVIETNFYSTSGTKIGINQGEYVDLHDDVMTFNDSHETHIQFMWITDGNYWVSKNGETRFLNLKGNYFKGDFELLSYNLFKQFLPQIKQSLES